MRNLDNNFIETSVSGYDAVNAFLISSILVVGTLVAIMFLIWLTMIANNRTDNGPGYVVDQSFGLEKPEGFADDVHEPGVEEFPEVETPQLADALEAVSEAISSVQANLEARDGDAAEMGKGSGFGARDGGPGTGNFKGVPEYKRWKIEYRASNIDEYARQLSFFNIDIGVISNANNKVFRLQKPGVQDQVLDSTRENENKALFFIHEKQRLRRWDESLVKKQNISLNDAFTVQFYPQPIRQALRQLEAQYLQKDGKELADVRRTRYKVIVEDEGFSFKISTVEYQ